MAEGQKCPPVSSDIFKGFWKSNVAIHVQMVHSATKYFHLLPLSHHYQQFKRSPTIVLSPCVGREHSMHGTKSPIQYQTKN